MFGASFNKDPNQNKKNQSSKTGSDIIAQAFDRMNVVSGSMEITLHDVPEGECELFMKTICPIIQRTYQVHQWDGYKEYQLVTHDEDKMNITMYTPTDEK